MAGKNRFGIGSDGRSWLLEGEKLEETIEDARLGVTAGGVPMTLIVSNYRLLFTKGSVTKIQQLFQAPIATEIPLGTIAKYEVQERKGARQVWKLTCRDIRVVQFSLPEKAPKIVRFFLKYNTPGDVASVFASAHFKVADDGWKIYTLESEFNRQGLLFGGKWKMAAQNGYDICSNYPIQFGIPSLFNSSKLGALAKGRHAGRIPILSWYDQNTNTVLCRAAVEEFAVVGESAVDPAASEKDDILAAVLKSNNKGKLAIVDANGLPTDTKAQQRYRRFAYKALCLPMPSELNNSYRKLITHLLGLSGTDLKNSLAKDAPQVTSHLAILTQLLSSSCDVAATIHADISVLLQTSDGADLAAVLASLSQMMFDPYHRTLRGFFTLIEREWLNAGCAVGWRPKKFLVKAKDDDLGLSAAFGYFIDCVWQMWQQQPAKFEFNEETLVYILDHLYSARFGTFLCSTDKLRRKHKLALKCPSLWAFMLQHEKSFRNQFYTPPEEPASVDEEAPVPKPVLLDIAPAQVSFWGSYYLRYMNESGEEALAVATQEAGLTSAELSVPSCKLTTLPAHLLDGIEQPSLVATVDLSSNLLSALPLSCLRFSALTRLLLASNHLNPSRNLFELFTRHTPQLAELDLSNNCISKWCVTLAFPSALQTLKLGNNRLTELPAALASFTSLHTLVLSNNNLSSLGEHLPHSLQHLEAENNNITVLPRCIRKITGLQTLKLAHNKLEALADDALDSFKLLTHLTLAGNSLVYTSDKDGSLSVRGSVILGGGGSPSPSGNASTASDDKLLRASRSMESNTARGAQRSKSPQPAPVAAQSAPSSPAAPQSSLLNIDLRLRSVSSVVEPSNRNLKRDLLLPTGLFARRSSTPLPNTNSAALSGTPVLPASLVLAQRLTTLNLSAIGLISFPREVIELDAIQQLYLSRNRIESLPPEIGRLRTLKLLDLEQNALQFLPVEIGMLRELESLNLAVNSLRELSPAIGQIVSLRTLNLARNRDLNSLPPSLGLLSQLKVLILDELDLKMPPREVVVQGPQPVITFLRDAMTASERLYRMKVMVVGQENVGKTTLLRALMRKNEKKKGVHEPNMSTDGIHIDSWSFAAEVTEKDATKSTPVNVTLSAWDFAGQDVYYSTHQFFLSDRSLYVLVWNLARPETESRLGYWLKVVQARAGKSPIVLVATHLDDKVCTKEYVAEQLAEVERKYRSPSLRFVRAVSCESGRGIEELRQEIETLVLTLDKMGELIPASYLTLEKFVLEERQRRMPPVVSLRTFQAMSAACNVTAADSQAVATRLLHSLGVLVHYGQDPRLKEFVILDPQWLIEVMASILTTKHSFARNGLLPLNALLQLWREPKFPVSLHSQLLQLLEHFEVVFRKEITDEPGAAASGPRELLLVPALLPEARPPEFKQRWRGTVHGGPPPSEIGSHDQNIIGRRFTLSFVPRGLLGRVLIRLLRWMEPLCLWQMGMVLQYGKETVLILLDNGSVDIFAHSPEPFSLEPFATSATAKAVFDTLVTLLSNWYKLEFIISVLCAHCLQKRTPMEEVSTFPFGELATDVLQKGLLNVMCKGENPPAAVRIDSIAPDVALSACSHKLLLHSDLSMSKKLGEGGMGSVYQGKYKEEKVAIKELNASVMSDEKQMDEFRQEVSVLASLKHPNLLRMVGFSLSPCSIVLELISGGDLHAYLRGPVPLSWGARTRVALDIARGIDFLHNSVSPPILHRDLKSPNVLLAVQDRHVIAKVADFGLAVSLITRTVIGRVVENPVWLAPEIMENREYAQPADVYSFGVILYEIAARQDFFGNQRFMAALEVDIIAGRRPELPSDTPAMFTEVVQAAWATDPDDRPPIHDIVYKLEKLLPSLDEDEPPQPDKVLPCSPTPSPMPEHHEPEEQRNVIKSTLRSTANEGL